MVMLLVGFVVLLVLSNHSALGPVQEVRSVESSPTPLELADLERIQRICAGVSPEAADAVALTCRQLNNH
jgi:hypothetical protein